MAIKTQCPRCRQPLSVPNKLAGSYASCPRCQGRFWVSKDAPVDGSASELIAMPPDVPPGWQPAIAAQSAVMATPPVRPVGPAAPPQVSPFPPPATPPAAPFRPQANPVAVPPALAAATVVAMPGVAPPVVPSYPRKVARLVTAEAAQSTLKLAADGQLPHLQLQEIEKKDRIQGKSKSVSPLLLVAAWVFSVVVTVVILLFNSGDTSDVTTNDKLDALAAIEKEYFTAPAGTELQPYQIYLREAHQARCRGDHKAERQYYRKVLDLLRRESRSGTARPGLEKLEKGITGSRDHDRKLEKLILTVQAE